MKDALGSKSITKWTVRKSNKQLLYLINNTDLTCTKTNQLINQYKVNLIKRPEVKNKDDWMLLRPCNYYKEMEYDKIVFPAVSYTHLTLPTKA